MMFFKKDKKKYLHKYELQALRATNGLLKQERYKFEIIERSLGNIYKGEQWIKTQRDIVSALEYAQSSMIRQLAIAHGFPAGTSLDIDLTDGKIKNIKLPEEKKEKDVKKEVNKEEKIKVG